MIVGDRGNKITLGGIANLCLEFEEKTDKLEKRNEELELLTEKLIEEKAEVISELDKANDEILRLENKIIDLECIGINTDEINDDHELY